MIKRKSKRGAFEIDLQAAVLEQQIAAIMATLEWQKEDR